MGWRLDCRVVVEADDHMKSAVAKEEGGVMTLSDQLR